MSSAHVAKAVLQRTVGLSSGRDGAGLAKVAHVCQKSVLKCQSVSFETLQGRSTRCPRNLGLPRRGVANAQRLDDRIRLSLKRHELLLDDAAPVGGTVERC